MQERDILLEIILSFFQNPLLEIHKIKSMLVVDISMVEPRDEVRKVTAYLFTIKYSIYHMAAK